MTHLDLCSGIGGFALAASRVFGAAHEPLAFVEIDAYCRAVLAKNWPHVPQHDDLRRFDARPLLGHVDLLTAGYPCQPFASPGLKLGTADPRHLWPEVFRAVEECRPRWCLFENSPQHVHMGLDDVLDDLEGAGYEAWSVVIPACAVDAPHRRERLWILAHADGPRQRQPQGVRDGGRGRAGDGGEAGSGCAVGDSHSTPAHPHAEAGPPRRATGEPGRWPAEPGVARMAHGVPAGMDRRKALGNAIVPDVAARILAVIRDLESEHPAASPALAA